MKKFSKLALILASASVLMSAHLSFAGCGSIACTADNGACVEAHGQPYSDYIGGPNRFNDAENAALYRCEVEYPGRGCAIKLRDNGAPVVECNTCTEVIYNNDGNSVQACF